MSFFAVPEELQILDIPYVFLSGDEKWITEE